MTAYASGTCDPLPWKLTSKHRGGISKIFTPPSLREHYVSMDKEKAGGGKNTSGGGGEKTGNVGKSLRLLSSTLMIYRILTWYLMLGWALAMCAGSSWVLMFQQTRKQTLNVCSGWEMQQMTPKWNLHLGSLLPECLLNSYIIRKKPQKDLLCSL